MKRTLLLSILLAIAIVKSQGQEKKIDLTLNDNEFFVDRIHLGEAGFMLKSTHRLFFYSSTCDQIWERNIKDNYSSGENVTVASPDGAVVYHISAKTDNFFKKQQYITQIKKDGQLKEFEVPPSKEFGKTVITLKSYYRQVVFRALHIDIFVRDVFDVVLLTEEIPVTIRFCW